MYYEIKREHLDGGLVLCTRGLTTAAPDTKNHRKPTWYMRLKIAGRKGYAGFTLFRQIGGSVGVAVFGTMFSRSLASSLEGDVDC